MSGERERPLRMSAEHSVLVLVDYQTRLMPAMHDRDRVTGRAAFAAAVAGELGIPVVGTAQNPAKLGPNVEPIASRCNVVVDKVAFGACEEGLIAQLDALRPQAEVVIGGCEAHVCLLQTALGLMEQGRRVWVLSDASGSRRPDDHKAAMRRLSDAGANVVTTEMAAFEWLDTSTHERFRAVSALVKATD